MKNHKTFRLIREVTGVRSGGRRILTELSLCSSVVNYYNSAQRYEQFLQVSWLDWAFILLDLALYLPRASISLVFMVLYISRYILKILLHSLLHILASWAWWDWPLTWLTSHHPSVLWHWWLGHLTCKIVPEMTYSVMRWMLNLLYRTVSYRWHVRSNC